jgi:hypothetical protein
LALMRKSGNEDVGNEKFTDKAKMYKKSDLELTRKIPTYAKQGEWRKESIEARQQKLAELAVKAWPNKVF